MDIEPKTIVLYETQEGRRPYADWFDGLKEKKTQIVLTKRVDRMAAGNFGSYRSLKEGLFELKIDYGPGYRIYFTQEEQQIILLLLGGDKSTQEADIQKAKEYYDDFKT